MTINHFLTADFALPSFFLYSLQHTDHHKPFPHRRLQPTRRLTVLTSTPLSPQTFSSQQTSHYLTSFCAHINRLIKTNLLLTADFTLPGLLLYSHQHTGYHKPLPHCRLHLTQPLTVLTSTHWSPQTISSLQTSHYPAPYCSYINTLITTNQFLTADFTLPSAFF